MPKNADDKNLSSAGLDRREEDLLRRKEKLETLARNAASRARRQHGSVKLAPMNAFERRIVHLALLDSLDVTTHSEGVDPERRVVVTYVRS